MRFVVVFWYNLGMKRSYACVDCGKTRHPMFMVHDALWAKARYHKDDIACRRCFEFRIGRKITCDDLTLCGLNFMEFPEFCTEENYRRLYAQDGLDYDKTKAEYFERCAKLGLKPSWTTSESSQTPQSDQSGCSDSPSPSHPELRARYAGRTRAHRRLYRQAGQDALLD